MLAPGRGMGQAEGRGADWAGGGQQWVAMVTAGLENKVTDRLVWTPEGKGPEQCTGERETTGCLRSPGDKGDLGLAEAS